MAPPDLHRLDGAARDLLATVRQLGAFRRANTWLITGALGDISTKAGALSYVVAGDHGSVRVRVNPTTQTVRFPPDEERSQPVLGAVTPDPHHVDIPPLGWALHRYPVR